MFHSLLEVMLNQLGTWLCSINHCSKSRTLAYSSCRSLLRQSLAKWPFSCHSSCRHCVGVGLSHDRAGSCVYVTICWHCCTQPCPLPRCLIHQSRLDWTLAPSYCSARATSPSWDRVCHRCSVVVAMAHHPLPPWVSMWSPCGQIRDIEKSLNEDDKLFILRLTDAEILDHYLLVGLWITKGRQLVHDAGETVGGVVHCFTVSKHDCLILIAEVVCGRLPHLFITRAVLRPLKPPWLRARQPLRGCGHRASRVHEWRVMGSAYVYQIEGKRDRVGDLWSPPMVHTTQAVRAFL
jgi:hypothetical protein